MSGYTYITRAQLRSLLASRLNDTGATLFWADDEKNRIINEGLRTWNSLTNMWKVEFTFSTVANQAWYNIPSLSGSSRPYTVTDNDILVLTQYSLLEPITTTYPISWLGSLQFTMADVLNAIQRRRDEVLSLTQCTTTQSLLTLVSPGRVFVPDNVIDIRRVAFIPNSGSPSQLWRDDLWAVGAFERDLNFTSPPSGTPSNYQMNGEPPISFDVDQFPAVAGNWDLLTVNAGPALSTSAATLLSIPDDWFWVIRWGALGDLFAKESNAKDVLRAQYCEARYKQGLAALLQAPAVLWSRINGIAVDIQSVQDLDNFRTGWQAETHAKPDAIATAGLNLLALAAIPNNTSYSITIGTVQNAPMPANDSSQIQVSREDLEVILDYCVHIASLKMGGAEFLATIPLLDRFHKKAAAYNSKLNELGEYTKPMFDLSQLQAESSPVFETIPDED